MVGTWDSLKHFSRPYIRPTVALMLGLYVFASVVCKVMYSTWLNGASFSKSYFWQPIGSRIREINWYQNRWPWPLFKGRLRSREQWLRHIRHWISQKPLATDLGCKGPSIGNGLWGIKWSCYRWHHLILTGQTRDPNTPNISKTAGNRDSVPKDHQ